MTANIIVFTAEEGDQYKRHIDLRAGSYVFAGPEDPAAGPLKLHTARCMHVRDNKTAALIGPGEMRVVGPTARDLYSWLTADEARSGQATQACQSCKTAELVRRYAHQ